MEDQIYFLEDGQECFIKEAGGGKYRVQKIKIGLGEDGYIHEIKMGKTVVVDMVFRYPPTLKINEEISHLRGVVVGLLGEIERLCVTKDQLTNEINSLQK